MIGVVTIEDVIPQIHCVYFLSFFSFFLFHASAFPPFFMQDFIKFHVYVFILVTDFYPNLVLQLNQNIFHSFSAESENQRIRNVRSFS